MAVIDIKKSYRHISPEELRSGAYSGIVYCGSSEIAIKILEDGLE